MKSVVMKSAVIFSLLVLFTIGSVYAQTMEPGEADEYFTNKRFGQVWCYYRDMLKADPSDPDLNFKMGVCYLNSRSQKEKAFEHFKKAMNGNAGGSEITFKLLADACYLASNYDEAIVNYEKHLKTLHSKKETPKQEIDETLQKIQMSKMAKEIIELKETISGLKKQTEGRFKDSCSATACSVPNDPLASGIRKDSAATKNNSLFSECVVKLPGKNELITKINPDTSRCLKEATVASSADGQIILIYRHDNEEGNLYVSAMDGNEWTITEKLNKTLNNREWEPYEFISADGTELYFSCEREGGYGGKDIYRITKLPDGDWSEAKNLGPEINSPFDEIAPAIHPNLGTLYFSSNRYKANGGYDIFTSTLSDSGYWRAPVTVGYPVYKSKTDPKKEDIKKKAPDKKAKERENYLVTFLDPKKAPLTMVKGKVVDTEGKIPPYVEITITNNETGDVLGVYNTNSKTGSFAFILPPGKNSNIIFESEGYLFHTENIDISKGADDYKEQQVIELVPLANGSSDVLNNLFFEEKNAELTKASLAELDRLYNFLSEKGTLMIEISANINKESAADMKLAESKVQSITNYLVGKGIDKERLSTKVYRKSKRSKRKTGKESLANETLEIKILNI